MIQKLRQLEGFWKQDLDFSERCALVLPHLYTIAKIIGKSARLENDKYKFPVPVEMNLLEDFDVQVSNSGFSAFRSEPELRIVNLLSSNLQTTLGDLGTAAPEEQQRILSKFEETVDEIFQNQVCDLICFLIIL